MDTPVRFSGGQGLRDVLVDHRDIGLGLAGFQLAVVTEITPLRHALTVDGDE
jgi:hypothetical protein